MIRAKEFKGFTAQYHRNGIDGAGFYCCRFYFPARAKVPMQLQAIVFDAPGFVAVTCHDPRMRWRGDEFEPAVREALAALEAADPMAAHVHPDYTANEARQ